MKKIIYFLLLNFSILNIYSQEIDIRGKNVSITDGSTTTSLLNSTDFGKQQSSAGTIVQKFTIYNTGNTALTIGAISFSGTNSADFSVTTSPSSSVAAGNSTTFEVTFNPGGTGSRTANISIVNNDGNENPYDFNIAGTGIADRTVRWVNNQGASRPSTVTLQGLTYNTASATYTNINAALVAASTNDIVYITDGTYRNPNGTTSTNCSLFGMAQDTSLYLNVNKSNIIITSQTGDYSTSNAKLVGYGFNLILEFSTDITIQGLKMDSVRTNAFWNSNTVWGPSAGVKILKNYVTNTYGHGIKTDGAIQVAYGTFNRGVWEIKGNYFENIGFYKYSACSYQAVSAIWLSIAGPVVEITDNTIINTKWAGVLTVGHGSNNPSIANGGITISNNIIEKTVDAGIQIGFPTDAFFYPSNALISGNFIKEANTSSKVGIGGITMLYSDLVETKILNNHITQSFNGLAIEIAGWRAKQDTTIIRYNNFCSLSGGFAVTHIAGVSPNGTFGTGDDLAKYKFDNNYWGDPTGPTYTATNPNGKGTKLRKDTITLGGGTYSLNNYNYLTPFSATPNVVATAGSCLCPPEINVKGNNINIVDGDITPSLTDSTNFGTVVTGTKRRFRILNTGNSSLIISSIIVSGANSSDFVVSSAPSSIAAGDSAFFNITFSTVSVGARSATITINNNDCDETAYDFAITAKISQSCGPVGRIVSSQNVPWSPSYLTLKKITLPAGVVDSIGIRLNASATATVFLYTDNAGVPDLLLTQSSSLSLNSGDNICNVTDITITAGDYWIGATANAVISYRGNTTTTNHKYKGLSYGTALPTNIGGTANISHGELDFWPIICTGCSFSSPLPTTAGTYTSAQTGTVGAYTCYCDGSNNLLLALDLTSTGAVIPSNGVSLQIGSTVTTAWNNAGGIISNPTGGAIVNRKWNVTPTTQPTSPVKVRYFFTQREYDSVVARLAPLGTTISVPTQLQMYKLFTGSFGDPHAGGATGVILMNGGSSTLNQWLYSTYGSNHSAEYLVASFSGGGGGGGAGGIPLPVEFINFTAKGLSNTSSLLKWQTTSEIDYNYFDIERSLDGNNFKKIGTIKANGNNQKTQNYQYVDNSIAIETIKAYYRIKQLDVNGNNTSTNIQLVNFMNTNIGISVYPNPFNETLQVQIEVLQENETAQIIILDALGKEVYNKSVNQVNNDLELTNLSKGIYQLIIKTETQTKTIKIIK